MLILNFPDKVIQCMIKQNSKKPVNPFTPETSLISYSPYCLPHNSCAVWLENLVVNQLKISPNENFSIFSSLSCLMLSWYCEEKFLCGHIWEYKGSQDS